VDFTDTGYPFEVFTVYPSDVFMILPHYTVGSFHVVISTVPVAVVVPLFMSVQYVYAGIEIGSIAKPSDELAPNVRVAIIRGIERSSWSLPYRFIVQFVDIPV
jgi:hypothetical protein